MKLYSILCLLSFARLQSQSSSLENKVFYYVYDQTEMKIIEGEELRVINENQRKTKWNRFCGGLFSHKEEILILFQTLKYNLTINSVDDLFSLSKETMKTERFNSSIKVLESYTLPESNAIFYSSINLGNEYWHTYTVLTNFGMITMKIVSSNPINFSTKKYLSNLNIKAEYIGFPSKTFLGSINWEDVILAGVTKALSPGIKLPKAKGN